MCFLVATSIDCCRKADESSNLKAVGGVLDLAGIVTLAILAIVFIWMPGASYHMVGISMFGSAVGFFFIDFILSACFLK